MSISKMDVAIMRRMKKARLLVNIPSERADDLCGDGGLPKAGDTVLLDQGFTFPDGKAGGLVRCVENDGRIRYEAEVYETEMDVET
ncbi:MAG: hypothetical protein V4812_01600 [Pseudomonadota bacterium]